MICKSVEGYLKAVHGTQAWEAVCRDAGLRETRFEALRTYDDAVFLRVAEAAARHLGRGQGALLEDVGAWLCTHDQLETVRRLLRLCGRTYRALLFSLEEMEARARLSLPDLDLPSVRLSEAGGTGRFAIHVRWSVPGGGALVAGVLRAMASDHGALAVIETGPSRPDGAGWAQDVTLHLVREAFHAPRGFALGEAAG